jgi:hypothetical protein
MLAGPVAGYTPAAPGGSCEVSKSIVSTNFLHSLVAVLAGNALYLLVSPYLPPLARHHWRRLDLGLVVDFWFCLVIFGMIKTIAWLRSSKK